MSKTLLTGCVAAAGLAVSGLSFAAAASHPMVAPAPAGVVNPWYVGVGINYYAGLAEKYASNDKLDKSNLGFNILAGYRLNSYFGTEAQFNWIGKREYMDFDSQGAAIRTKVDRTINVNYDGLFYMPLNQYFEVFAKGGVNYLYTRTTDNASTEKSVLSTFGLNAGAGLQLKYQQFGVRAEYVHLFLNPNTQENHGVFYPPNYINLDVMYFFG